VKITLRKWKKIAFKVKELVKCEAVCRFHTCYPIGVKYITLRTYEHKRLGELGMDTRILLKWLLEK
jgi:hypothetical protein